ncbi:hypothetical protein AB0K02_23475 [Streptomyces sp. NPDC049597]|uniref:hypothetical protein n=1 Tax=Streptomyces sp. NPDC049597 TaxID=3155276 RepID=UPI0034423461
MSYDCPVCLEPLAPDSEGTIAVVGVTKDQPDNWVWGPYPVHDAPCSKRLAHPELLHLLDLDGHVRTQIRLPAHAPTTRDFLAHSDELTRSPFVRRYSLQ